MTKQELETFKEHLYNSAYDFYFDCFYNCLDEEESPYSYSYEELCSLIFDLFPGSDDGLKMINDISNEAKHDAKESAKKYHVVWD